MSLNIFSIVIILLILMMGVVGAKRGILKQLVLTVGTILVFVIAFFLKDSFASFLSSILPFWNFRIPLGNLISLNIIFYQLLAFLLIVILLRCILQIVLNITGFLNKIINATIILALPNQLLGFVVGILEGIILMFVVLNIVSIPLSGSQLFMESKVRSYIVNDMPILKDTFGNMNVAITDILSLNPSEEKNINDLKVIDIMLKDKIVSKDYILNLKEKGKLDTIENIDSVLNKY